MDQEGGLYTAFRLPAVSHIVNCRAIDTAGNRSEIMTGDSLSGGSTAELQVEIR